MSRRADANAHTAAYNSRRELKLLPDNVQFGRLTTARLKTKNGG
jgi:hypothetical protein